MGLNRSYREQFDAHGELSLARVVQDDWQDLPVKDQSDFRDVMRADMARMHEEIDAEDARRNSEPVTITSRVLDRLRPFDHIFEVIIQPAVSAEAGQMLREIITIYHTRQMEKAAALEQRQAAALAQWQAERREAAHA